MVRVSAAETSISESCSIWWRGRLLCNSCKC